MSEDEVALKNYYAGMADAIRYIENGVKSGLSLTDSMSTLKKEVSSRREIINATTPTQKCVRRPEKT